MIIQDRCIFQSTLPHRERHEHLMPRPYNIYFNPRSHTGSDSMPPDSLLRCRYFNPRSHTGSDQDRQSAIRRMDYFNPRSHTGSDGCTRRWIITGSEFQSTLPHGERPILEVSNIQTAQISIHAPTRGATAILYKNFAYFHSYVTIINIHCISMHPFADA